VSPDPTQTTSAGLAPPPAGTPTPASTSAAPPASTSPPPAPPAAPSTGGSPGASGAVGGAGATPAAGQPAFSAGASPATQAGAGGFDAGTYTRQIEELRAEQQRLLPLAQIGYQQYLRQQQQPAPAATPQKPANPFGLPEFDHGLLKFLRRDPATGAVVAEPGAPPDAAARYAAYMDRMTQVQQQFWADPMQFLGQQVEQRAGRIAQQLIQQHLGGYQEQVKTDQIVQQNADWIFAAGPGGQRQYRTDPLTGRQTPVLTPQGQAYARFVEEATRLGIGQAEGQHRYAVEKLQLAMLLARQQGQQAAQQGQQAAQQFTQAAAAQPPGAPPPASVPVPAAQPGKTLRDVMRERFEQNGITNQTLAQQMTGAA
jgi:hypothetical protein